MASPIQEDRMDDVVTMPNATPELETTAEPVRNGMAALGELICSLNPYTDLPHNNATGLATGDMELMMLPTLTVPPGGPVGTPNIGAMAGIALEIEQNYAATWNFKGQPQVVKTAARIPYRFPVYKNDRLVYWRTEYLLIGLAGAEGGG
jgi:hypothetical protein